jgi:membrane protein required for colicin V production
MDHQAIIETATNLHWIDIVGICVAGLFLALGLWRGLWWQVVRLLGLAAAVGIARWVGPVWGEDMAEWAGLNEAVAAGLGWFCAFLLTLVGAAFLGSVGSSTIDAMKLSLVNRFFGAVAGLVTGLLLHSALSMAGSLFASQEWRSATFAPTYSGQLVDSLTKRWPVLSSVPLEVMNELQGSGDG